jgi:dimethylargininase
MGRCLHLKSAVTEAAPGLVLVNPQWVNRAIFDDHRTMDVDPSEPHAANVLRIRDRVLCASQYPRTSDRLRGAGLELSIVDVSELAKAEGAVTCCSLIVTR